MGTNGIKTYTLRKVQQYMLLYLYIDLSSQFLNHDFLRSSFLKEFSVNAVTVLNYTTF